jgi:hypothetical protein
LLPASWGANRRRGAVAEWLATSPYFDLSRARLGMALVLAAFGAQAVVAAALAAFATA